MIVDMIRNSIRKSNNIDFQTGGTVNTSGPIEEKPDYQGDKINPPPKQNPDLKHW